MNRRTLIAILAAIAAAVLLTAGSCDSGGQRAEDQKISQQTYQQQIKAQPYPASQLRDSLERANLRERLLRENVASQVRYIYLLGDTGTYIGYYTIKGKVSSNQSQMQPQDDIADPCSSSFCPTVVDGPGDDGSYGEDARGQFFFTTEGVMVSTDMRYIVSDAPLAVDAPRLNVPKK
ncbi:MAG TPA: hypothetical protein VFM55_19125 [Micromonosporaceae bacterium]|nr:hypothetical protein [Micromonosporaceae bacterium]